MGKKKIELEQIDHLCDKQPTDAGQFSVRYAKSTGWRLGYYIDHAIGAVEARYCPWCGVDLIDLKRAMELLGRHS